MTPEEKGQRPLFSRRETVILHALARTIIPRGGSFSSGADDIPLADLLADYLRRLPYPTRIGYRLLLHFVNLASLVFTLRTFIRLSPEKKTRFLENWENSRIYPWRQLFLFVKMLILMVFYGHPRVHVEIDYQLECFTGRRPGS